MADEQSAKPQPRKKRRWLRRALFTCLFLLLAIVVFHRPIIHHGGRWAAIWLAKRQHMILDLRIKGNIWSRLELHNVTIKAADTGKAPVATASLDRAVAEYDLWRLIKGKGDLAAIRLLDIGNATVDLTPVLDIDPEPPRPLLENFRGFLGKPFPTPRVALQRLDLRNRGKTDDLVVRGLKADLAPNTTGTVSWERIEVPGLPVMEASQATVTLTPHRLAVTGVAIWPEVQVVSATAQRQEGSTNAELAIEVALPDGRLTGNVLPNLTTGEVQARANLETRGVAALAPRFGLSMPLVLEFVSLQAEWRGVPEQANTSNGLVKFSASGRKDVVVPGWAASGTATLEAGQLSLSGVQLRAAESVLVASGNFDARKALAHRGKGPAPLPEGRMELKLSAPDLQKAAAEFRQQAHGAADVAATVTTTANAARFQATITGQNVGQRDVTAGQLNVALSGELPVTEQRPLAVLVARAEGSAERIRAGDVEIDRAQFKGTLDRLRVTLTEAIVTRGANQARFEGATQLQETGALAGAPAIRFTLSAPAIAEFGLKAGDLPITGALQSSGSLIIRDGKLVPEGTLTATDLVIGETRAGDVALRVGAEGDATTVNATITRGSNRVEASSRAIITAQGKLAGTPTVQFTVDAPAIGEFGLRVKNAPVAGTLRGSGKVSLMGGLPAGDAKLTASDLMIGEAKAGTVTLDAVAENGTLMLRSARAQFNATDFLEATGRLQLRAPRAYEGAVSVDARDLAAFQPILEALGQKKKLGGSLQLSWTGKSDGASHTGDGKLIGKGLRVDATEIDEARLTADYNPERVNVPEFLVIADELRATGKLDWVNKRLSLRGLEVQVAGKTALSGDATIPLDPVGKSVLPGNLPIVVSFAARNLDIARVYRELKMPPPIEGTITATLTASGNLTAPVVKLDLEGRGMRLPMPTGRDITAEQRAFYNTARGDFDADLNYAEDRLAVNGTFRQADIRPLTVKLEAPLALKPILEGKTPDLQKLPFTASINLPASSLAIVPKLSPAVRRADGTIAIAVEATGTISEPRLNGQVTLDGRSIRMMNNSIPPISNLAGRVALSGNTVTVQRFEGETGGGRFSIGGTVVAQNLLEPVIDARIRTDKVLAMRNDSVLVRVDADIQLRGPINKGAATGRVVLAQSRFNKEIQILPIILPGRPKPVPREVAQPTVISFPNPPLRDWTFDIAIVTSNEDPFLVRGNLAKGQVLVDLRLQGTGLEPYLVGNASMEQFSAQLPVSRLTTRRGLINFSRENPFQPTLEIESETVVRGYTIIARLDGPASAPRLDLTSEPPLPQQEIMSLLTTGSLAGELGENNSALATRAGLIVLRDLYKRVFKRDLPVPSDEGGDNFFQRFNVDLGAVDSRTGRQEVTAQFRVTDQVVIVGDVEMGGGISGRVQYLFRFR